MAVRADFYIKSSASKIGKPSSSLIWLGSITYDGEPENITTEIFESDKATTFHLKVKKEIESRDDSFYGNEEWPWAWENSLQTDFTYIYDVEKSKVYISHFGKGNLDLETYQLCGEASTIAWDTFPSLSFPANMKDLGSNSLNRYIKESLNSIKPAQHPYDPYLIGGGS